jgi:hypothetical protein
MIEIRVEMTNAYTWRAIIVMPADLNRIETRGLSAVEALARMTSALELALREVAPLREMTQ